MGENWRKECKKRLLNIIEAKAKTTHAGCSMESPNSNLSWFTAYPGRSLGFTQPFRDEWWNTTLNKRRPCRPESLATCCLWHFHLIQVCVTSAVEIVLLSNLKIVGRNWDFCELWVFVFIISDWLIIYLTVEFLLFCWILRLIFLKFWTFKCI
jgi:hypothetical protein